MSRDVWRETMDAIDADRRDEAPDIMRDDSDDPSSILYRRGCSIRANREPSNFTLQP